MPESKGFDGCSGVNDTRPSFVLTHVVFARGTRMRRTITRNAMAAAEPGVSHTTLSRSRFALHATGKFTNMARNPGLPLTRPS